MQGTQSALVDTKKGKVVACVFAEAGSGAKWYRARIEGKVRQQTRMLRTTEKALSRGGPRHNPLPSFADHAKKPFPLPSLIRSPRTPPAPRARTPLPAWTCGT